MRTLALAFAIMLCLATNVAAKTVIEGCEGEGCGYTIGKIARDDFKLYKEMNFKSKLIGDFKKGTKVKNLGAFSLVAQEGNYRINKVKEATTALKVGDVVTRFFYHGEGWASVRYRGKIINFKLKQIDIETIKVTKLQTWFKLQVGNSIGYSDVLPLQGRLE
jgi:hypothetical protein